MFLTTTDTAMATIRTTSQSQARIVPWRDPLDLIWVKNAFYPSLGSPDQRNDALMMVGNSIPPRQR